MSERFAYGLSTPDEGKTYDLDVFSDIGESSWFSDDVSANEVRLRLRNNPGADVHLRLNTRGGDVFEAVAMYTLLAQHKGRVEATIMGLCASSGTIVMLAASKIRIVEAGLVMIHDVWGGTSGSSDDLRAWADVLDKLTDRVGALYAARTKKPKAEMLAMMASETWLAADQALDLGFVDEVIKLQTPKAAKARAMAFAMVRDAKGAPEGARALLAASETVEPSAPRSDDELRLDVEAFLHAEPGSAPPPPPPAPMPLPAPEPISPPAEPAKETSMNIAKVLQKLGLSDGAEESTVLATIDRLKASASAGSEIEKILGCVGAEALGAVRALKESKESLEALQSDMSQVKATMARGQFDAAIALGRKDRKLTPAAVAEFTKKFDAAIAASEDGTAVVSELQGFIKLAAPFASNARAAQTGSGSEPEALTWEGKTYAQLDAGEKHNLKRRDPELYNQMRSDHQAQTNH